MRNLYLIILLALLVKLFFSYWLPLSPDEAYYWVWSHHLQLSYYDHPPAISWLFWLGHPLENFGSAVRWPGVIVTHISFLIWCLILRRYLSLQHVKYWLVLALLTPLIGMGSLILTPDAPLMLFWSLSVWASLKWCDRPTFGKAFVAGSFVGLAFCSKYHAVLFAPMLLVWVHMESRNFRRIAIHGLWAVLGFFIFSLPVWIWNYQNEFISFIFQFRHGLDRGAWEPQWTLTYIGGQLALIFPTVAYLIYKNWGRANRALKFTAFFPLLFFLVTSFRGFVEANWPILSYPSLIALAVLNLDRKLWLKWTMGIWVSAFVLSAIYLKSPDVVPFEISSKASEIKSMRKIADFVKGKDPVYARTYQMASKLSFELKQPVYKLKGLSRTDFYDFLPQSLPSEEIFYVITRDHDRLDQKIRTRYVLEYEEIIDEIYTLKRFRKK